MGRRGSTLAKDIKGVILSHTRPGASLCSKVDCWSAVRTLGCIAVFYTFSITLTFYNQRFIRHFRFPLSITMTHLITKFVLAAFIRWILYCRTGRERVTLGWKEYIKQVAPPGITGSLDIGLSNWSFAFVTVSLYTMTKTTVIVFILFFSFLFRLEKPRVSLIAVVLFIATGLFMFTYESTQFHPVGFILLLMASFISGLRWTLTQVVLQRRESGLSNPLDMMYHIQPWMILALLPLSTGFEGLGIATSEYAFGYQDGYLLIRNLALLFAGAFIAFLLELSEILVVSRTSGLTLSVASIFKEVITLLLAATINGDVMSSFNVVGLFMCLIGIAIHVILKALYLNREMKDACHHNSTQNLLSDSSNHEDTESLLNSNRKRLPTL